MNTANRIFVALRVETRAQQIGNDEVAQLLELADALAAAIVAPNGAASGETIVVARACAALDAHLATCNLRGAIARVRASIDDLAR